MTTMTIADVERDAEGFFRDPARWTEAMVPDLAAAEGIDELTDAHWAVVRFVRAEYDASGSGPNVRALSRLTGVGVKDLYRLFPKGPAKIAARIAGIPKPRGCI
jgi:tRNA 2-thiouridine synthesizing protein E